MKTTRAPSLTPCGCTTHRPQVTDLIAIAFATAAGLVLFGLAAAVRLAWAATDVDLPDSESLEAELAGLVAMYGEGA